MSSDCIFCKIIKKEIPSAVVKEDKDVLVIKDIAPKAPIHFLIISKKHVPDVQSLSQEDLSLAGKLLLTAQELSKSIPAPGHFRLVVNSGKEAGQCVFHLHIHFLAGKKMSFE